MSAESTTRLMRVRDTAVMLRELTERSTTSWMILETDMAIRDPSGNQIRITEPLSE